jgi:hypothetical protein
MTASDPRIRSVPELGRRDGIRYRLCCTGVPAWHSVTERSICCRNGVVRYELNALIEFRDLLCFHCSLSGPTSGRVPPPPFPDSSSLSVPPAPKTSRVGARVPQPSTRPPVPERTCSKKRACRRFGFLHSSRNRHANLARVYQPKTDRMLGSRSSRGCKSPQIV